MRRAVRTLRGAGFDNLSLDLIYGIPGQSVADLELDLTEAIALEPEHLSCYELEAKPGTRFTYAHGDELERQAEAMEDYFERVVETLTAPATAGTRRRTSAARTTAVISAPATTSATGSAATISGSASAPSRPSAVVRWRNAPSLPGYLAALGRGERPQRELEQLEPETAARERVMLGLRLDQPLELAGLATAVDRDALARLQRHGLVEAGETTLELTRRGRFLGGGVTAELLVES